MSVEEKQIIIAQNVPKVFNAGYEKGKAEVIPAKEEQEKSVTINKNGTTDVLPDENKVLSKVTVDVNVPSDDSLAIGLIQRDMTEVVIPNHITEIGAYTFANFSGLKKVILPSGLKSIGRNAFFNSGLQSVEIPANLERTGLYAFGNCVYLTSVVMHNGLKVIENECFLQCASLKELILPDTLVEIQVDAFTRCGLVSINLPSSLTKIHNQPFRGCEQLTNLTVDCILVSNINFSSNSKLSVESIGSIVNGYADMTGKTSPILTVHPDVKAKIEANETWLNTLINKNVTLA